MLGTLITLGLGVYALGSAISGSATETENKYNAKKDNKPYYYDHNNKMRSTETNEICTIIFSSIDHHGHQVLIGCKTNRVYHDYTLEKLKKKNDEIRAEGKKYYIKEILNVKQSNSNKSLFMAYDPEKQLYYEIKGSVREKDPKRKYTVSYYEAPEKKGNMGVFSMKFVRIEWMSEEEVQPYYYGPTVKINI